MRRRTTPRILNQLPEPNTFIGGVGASYITSVADYVAKSTTIIVSDVVNFQNNSDNLSFRIDIGYDLRSWNTAENTYFIDLDGSITSIVNAFQGATANLTHLYLSGLITTSAGFDLLVLNEMKHINLDALTTLIMRSSFRIFPLLKKLYLPSLTSFNQSNITRGNSFNNMELLERLYIPNFSSMNIAMTRDAMIKQNFDNIGNGCKIYYNSAFGVTDRNGFNFINFIDGCSVGDTFTINGLVYTAVNTVTTDGEFTVTPIAVNQADVFNTAVNADTRTGSDYVGIRFGAKVLVYTTGVGVANNYTTTEGVGNVSNSVWDWGVNMVGGNDVHPFLINLRDNYSAILTETPNVIFVNPPTSLSASNITVNSVDLNFTLPTANANGNDGYEVWVDDGTIYRKLFEYSEIITSGDTVDLVDVVADVGTISGTKIKLRTIDGDYNFSAFSNEITIP